MSFSYVTNAFLIRAGKNWLRALIVHAYSESFSLMINVGTMPPPEVTFASSVEESRVNADPTFPKNNNGSRSTNCSTISQFPASSVNIGKCSLAVLTRS